MSTVRVKCVCGARLRLPDSVRGSEVRCWHCGKKVMVPNAAGSSSGGSTIVATPGRGVQDDEWIRVTCKCGKIVKAPPDCAGKKGECPRCQREVLLPGIPVDKSFGKTTKSSKRDPLEVFYNPDASGAGASGLGDLFGDESLTGQSSAYNAREQASQNLNLAADADAPTMISPRAPGSVPDPANADGSEGKTRSSLPKPTTLMDAAAAEAASSTSPVDLEKTQPHIALRDSASTTGSVPPPISIDAANAVVPTPTPSISSLDQISSSSVASPPPQEPPFSPVAQSPPKAKKTEPKEDQFLRVTCSCGKTVKAPLAMSGKIGKCPKCGKPVVMPYASRKTSYIPEPAADSNLGSEASATAVGFEAIRDEFPVANAPTAPMPRQASGPVPSVKTPHPSPPSGSIPVIIPPEPAKETTQESGDDGEEKDTTQVPADFVLTAQGISNKEWERRRRTKLYERIKRRDGIGGVLKLGAKDLLMLPLSLFTAGSNISPTQAAAGSIVLLFLGFSYLYYNWPRDYIDVQESMPKPARYYYSMTDDKLVSLTDAEYAKVEDHLANTDPMLASYMVRAYVYACGSCDTDPRQIVFLERFTPEARRATIEFEALINAGKGGTDQTKALASIIGTGHFIGRYIDPLAAPAGKKPGSIGAAPVPTTAPSVATSQPTTGPSGATTQAAATVKPPLIDKMNWVTFESGKVMLNSPLANCKNNALECLPPSKE